MNISLALQLLTTLPLTTLAATNDKDVAVNEDNNILNKKNVIFIICDDMRLDMAGFGGSAAHTPNLDKLRDVSVEFSNACTTTGLSSPSRAALFTGRLGHRTGLEDNLHLWHCRKLTLEKEHTTILEWADKADYNIGYFGKWHLGYVSPDKRGADECEISKINKTHKKPKRPNFEAIERYYDKSKTFEEKPEYYVTLDIPYEKCEAKRQVDLGVDFLNKAAFDKRPMFMTVSFHTPHPSYKVPKPWNKMYNYKDIELPKSMNCNKEGLEFQYDILWPWMNVGHMTDDDWRKTISYSMGMMTMFDKALGELFDAIKKQGLWEDTLIIFTSDQGSMLADHNLYDKGPYAYEDLMRIPMLIKAPGVEPKQIEHQVSLIDLNNTLVEYMGLNPSQPNLDSRSLWPLINEGDKAWSSIPDEAFYRYEYYNGRWFGVRTIRTPEYKYSFNPIGKDQLFNIKNDPNEMVNLVDNPEYAKVLYDIQTRLLTHLKQCEDTHSYSLMLDYTERYKSMEE